MLIFHIQRLDVDKFSHQIVTNTIPKNDNQFVNEFSLTFAQKALLFI
jgi:hypothetical protein